MNAKESFPMSFLLQPSFLLQHSFLLYCLAPPSFFLFSLFSASLFLFSPLSFFSVLAHLFCFSVPFYSSPHFFLFFFTCCPSFSAQNTFLAQNVFQPKNLSLFVVQRLFSFVRASFSSSFPCQLFLF